jgi:hypothetical protein
LSRGPERRLTVSPRWRVVDCIGGVLLVVGMLGLTGNIAGSAPALGDPQIGWSLVAWNVILLYCLGAASRSRRAQRLRRSSPASSR